MYILFFQEKIKINRNYSLTQAYHNLLSIFMRFKNLNLSKPKKVILILLLINLVAFSATKSIAEKYSPQQTLQTSEEKIGYIEKGWQIVNWSYNLLKYFKKPHTADNPS